MAGLSNLPVAVAQNDKRLHVEPHRLFRKEKVLSTDDVITTARVEYLTQILFLATRPAVHNIHCLASIKENFQHEKNLMISI